MVYVYIHLSIYELNNKKSIVDAIYSNSNVS